MEDDAPEEKPEEIKPAYDVDLTNPIIKSGLKVRYTGRKVVIGAGECTIDGNTIALPQPTKVLVPPSGFLSVSNEPVKFIDDSSKPTDNVVLSHCRAAQIDQTILRGDLVKDSVTLKTSAGADAAKLVPTIDFVVDANLGVVTRTARGAIKPGAKVFASYQCWRRRVDTIALDLAPKPHFILIQGIPARSAPEPPVIAPNLIPMANVISDWGDGDILLGNVMPIENPIGPFDPKLAEHNRRAMAPVIKKLEAGEPVKLVYWGDSVCLGYDARTKDDAFSNAFVAELHKRFPNANITVNNLGVASSNSSLRLPKVATEVFGLKPDLLIVEYVNDFALPSHVITHDYEELLDEAKKNNTRVILCTPHCPSPRMARAATWDAIADKPYLSILHELVGKNEDVALADVFNRWQHLPREGLRAELLLVNGLNHPNNKGHSIYVEELMRCFVPADQVASH